jgi:hypothetical protein
MEAGTDDHGGDRASLEYSVHTEVDAAAQGSFLQKFKGCPLNQTQPEKQNIERNARK